MSGKRRDKKFVTTISELKRICREKKKELLDSEVPERTVDNIKIFIPIECIENWEYVVREETPLLSQEKKE